MKCIVKDCENHSHEGLFIGSLCIPCHKYISTGAGEYSQAHRNTPQKREWVGLTVARMEELTLIAGRMGYTRMLQLAEDELKELNK